MNSRNRAHKELVRVWRSTYSAVALWGHLRAAGRRPPIPATHVWRRMHNSRRQNALRGAASGELIASSPQGPPTAGDASPTPLKMPPRTGSTAAVRARASPAAVAKLRRAPLVGSI